MNKTKKKKLEAFNKINKNDKLFINLDGFYDYKNSFSPMVSKSAKSLLKTLCISALEDKDLESFKVGKNALCDIFDRYHNVFPNIQDMSAISSKEYQELMSRLSVYFV